MSEIKEYKNAPMPDEQQNQTTEPQNPPKADEVEIVEQPIETKPQAEISEPTITEEPKEEAQPIESPQEEKPAEEISAPVEAVELPQAEEIKKEQSIIAETENPTEQEQIPEVSTQTEPIPIPPTAETPKEPEQVESQPIPEPPKPEVVQTPQPQKTQQPKTIEKIVEVEKVVYKTDPNIIQKLLNKANAKIQERKRAKLDKIMALFEAKPQISNKDVQKLLHARRRTATNYLDQLEAEQKIIQVGKIGKGVLYIKKP